jgi:predicted ATPase
MITSLEIQNFRGLKQVTLSDLRRVNLIVGGNDTGKTSVLESLLLLFGRNEAIEQLPRAFRVEQTQPGMNSAGNNNLNYWPWLFYDRSMDNRFHLSARFSEGETADAECETARTGATIVFRSLPKSGKHELLRFESGKNVATGRASVQSDLKVAHLSTHAANPVDDAERYNQVALASGGEERFETIMRKVEPRLRRLRYAKLPGTTSPLVFVDLGLSQAVPATQMGQAFNRLLHLYTNILASRAKILLVDEIENGVFSEALPNIWRGLLEICEQEQVQLFATTHSRECVMAAHAAAKERGKDDLCVQRLQLVKGQVEAVRLGEKHLELAAEMGLEVRS